MVMATTISTTRIFFRCAGAVRFLFLRKCLDLGTAVQMAVVVNNLVN